MEITEDMIRYAAALTKLKINEEEEKKLEVDLYKILDYMATMNELDTDAVEPMTYVQPMKNVFREDLVQNGDISEQLLRNAPMKKDGCYAVPKTLE